MQNNEIVSEINRSLKKAKNVLITLHKEPDADAACSALTFKWYLNKYFPDINSQIQVTGQLGSLVTRYKFLNSFQSITPVKDLSNSLSLFDTVVFLDASTLKRFTNFSEEINIKKYKTICIDHHESKQSDFEIKFIDSSYTSTSEILCKHFLTDKNLKDKNLAEIVFTGIYADSGGFRFVNGNNADVFNSALRIVKNSNISVEKLLSKFNYIEVKTFRLLKILINNTQYIQNPGILPPLTYTYFSKADIENLDLEEIRPARSHYFKNYIREIEGYQWGFLITPLEDRETYKVAFRSSPGNPNAAEIAHFLGNTKGGHAGAAGANVNSETFGMENEEFSKLDSKDIANLIINKLSEAYKDKIIKNY